MKEYNEAEIKSKAEVYCSSVERCPSDVEEKIRKWGASEEVTERIMAHLQKERYLDAARFCRFSHALMVVCPTPSSRPSSRWFIPASRRSSAIRFLAMFPPPFLLKIA